MLHSEAFCGKLSSPFKRNYTISSTSLGDCIMTLGEWIVVISFIIGVLLVGGMVAILVIAIVKSLIEGIKKRWRKRTS